MAGTLSIGRHIHENSAWTGEHLVEVADEALSAYEDQKYSHAVTKAGSCLEGVLTQFLLDWKSAEPKVPTLGRLIGDMRETGKAPSELPGAPQRSKCHPKPRSA